MKDQAIVGNIGHFDNEIDMAGLAQVRRASSRINIKPQVDKWIFPDGHAIIVLSRGPPAEPRQRDRPPELRDVELLHQPDDRPDRAVRRSTTSTRRRSTCCRSTSTRRSRGSTSTRSACELTKLTRRAGRRTSACPSRARTSPTTTGTSLVVPPSSSIAFDGCEPSPGGVLGLTNGSDIGSPCVLARLGSRSPSRDRTFARNH